MDIVSMFDGISCGRQALDNLGFKVDNYFAFEINPFSIAVSQKNFPDIKQMGDVCDADFSQFKDIDLLIGGSPCQSLSNANVYLKNGEYGVNGDGKSKLFWYFALAKKLISPKYFLFENVSSMRNEDKRIITEELGVEPIKLDSYLFSPQVRRRLYWTNIEVPPPSGRLVSDKLIDILEPVVDDKYYVSKGSAAYVMNTGTGGWRGSPPEINPEYGKPVVASCWKWHRANTDTYVTRESYPENRSIYSKLTPLECERLQTLPDNYTYIEGLSTDKKRYEAIGNGWNVKTIEYILKHIK